MLKHWLLGTLSSSFLLGGGVVARFRPRLAARRKTPARHAAASTRGARDGVTEGGAYRAVSIVPRLPACHAVEACLGRRFLMREQPKLPVAGCSFPNTCKCRFQMHADRRKGERRNPHVIWPRMRLLGIDRRGTGRGRRATDRR